MISYAEGGEVNALARWLAVGDEIEARGLVHPNGSLHVEQLASSTQFPASNAVLSAKHVGFE